MESLLLGRTAKAQSVSSDEAAAPQLPSAAARQLASVRYRTPESRNAYRLARRLAAAASHWRHLSVLTAAVVVSCVLVAANWSATGMLVLAAGTLHYFWRVAALTLSRRYAMRFHGPPGPPLEPDVLPQDIEVASLRAKYQQILVAHECLRLQMRESERVRSALEELYDACEALAQMAGRVAHLGNRLDQYLSERSYDVLVASAAKLEARSFDTSDEEAKRTLIAAASIRRREVLTHLELQGQHDRIHARLEAVLASLEMVLAMVVKVRSFDHEELSLCGERVYDQVDMLRDELALVELAIAEAITP